MKRAVLTITTAALLIACGGSGDRPGRDERSESEGQAASSAGARASAAGAAAGGGAAQAGAVDPCRIVTKAELEAALGIPLGGGQREPGVGESCRYKSPRDSRSDTIPTVTVGVSRSHLAGPTYNQARNNSPSTVMDVPGLGEKAHVYIGTGSSDFRELWALQGDVLFTIHMNPTINPSVSMSAEEKQAKLIALARAALGRL